MPTCKQSVGLLAGDDGTTLGWRGRLSLSLHFLMCETCRRYKAQIEAIRAAAKHRPETGHDPGALASLKDRILGERSSENQE